MVKIVKGQGVLWENSSNVMLRGGCGPSILNSMG